MGQRVRAEGRNLPRALVPKVEVERGQEAGPKLCVRLHHEGKKHECVRVTNPTLGTLGTGALISSVKRGHRSYVKGCP